MSTGCDVPAIPDGITQDLLLEAIVRPHLPVLLLGLLCLSCSNSLAPPVNVAGAWAADYHLPGSSLVLNLSQTDSVITGNGTYAGEAGPSGTLQISGSYVRPHITLALHYDRGLSQTYDGAVLDSQHMTGTIADSTGFTATLTFIRR
jgi:hypothetical protein